MKPTNSSVRHLAVSADNQGEIAKENKKRKREEELSDDESRQHPNKLPNQKRPAIARQLEALVKEKEAKSDLILQDKETETKPEKAENISETTAANKEQKVTGISEKTMANTIGDPFTSISRATILMLVNATINDLSSAFPKEIQAYKNLCREGKNRRLSTQEIQYKEYLRTKLKSECDETMYNYYSYGLDTPPEDLSEEKQSSLLTRIKSITYESCHLISQQQDKIIQAEAFGSAHSQTAGTSLKGPLEDNYYIRPNNFSATEFLKAHLSKGSARLALNLDPEYIPDLLGKLTKLFQGEFAELISQYKVMSMNELASSMDKVIIYLNDAGQLEKVRKLANHIHSYVPTEAWRKNIPLSMDLPDSKCPGIAYGEISPRSKSASYGESRAEGGANAICDLHWGDGHSIEKAIDTAFDYLGYLKDSPALIKRVPAVILKSN